MRRYILTIILLSIFTFPLFARIGETVDQCKARYGKVIMLDSPPTTDFPFRTIIFFKNGFVFVILFLNEIEEQVTISYQNHGALNENDIQTLLQADANGGTWKVLSYDDPEMWSNSNGCKAMQTLPSSISIFSPKASAILRNIGSNKLKDF